MKALTTKVSLGHQKIQTDANIYIFQLFLMTVTGFITCLNKITGFMVNWYVLKRVYVLFFLAEWNTFLLNQDIFSNIYWFKDIDIQSILFLWNSKIVFELCFKDSSFRPLIKTSGYWTTLLEWFKWIK